MPTPRGSNRSGGQAASTSTELLDPAQTSALEQVRALVESKEAELLQVLPASVTLDRLKGVYLHALERNPALLTCSPASLVRALMHAAETGLEPTGVLGLAYLVPRYNSKTGRDEAHFEIGYRGFMELARASRQVDVVDAHNVFWGDTYRVIHGTTPQIIHKPLSKDRTWDNLRGSYAFGKLSNGSVVIEEMSKEEIEALRDKHAPRNRAGELTGPWTSDPDRLEMARKTPIRRLAKRLPLTKWAERAIQLTDESYEDTGGFEDVRPAPKPAVTGGTKRDRIMGAIEPKAEPKDVTPREPVADTGAGPVDADGEVITEGGEEVIGEPPPEEPAAPPPVTHGQSFSGQIEFSDRASTNGELRRPKGVPTIGFRLLINRRGTNVEATGALAEQLDKVFAETRLGGGSPITVIGAKERRSFEKEGEGTISYDVIVAGVVTDGAGTWAGE